MFFFLNIYLLCYLIKNCMVRVEQMRVWLVGKVDNMHANADVCEETCNGFQMHC